MSFSRVHLRSRVYHIAILCASLTLLRMTQRWEQVVRSLHLGGVALVALLSSVPQLVVVLETLRARRSCMVACVISMVPLLSFVPF